MKDYSKYLICTDLDGTFTDGGVIVEKNLPAIEEFIAGGGKFTVATGRAMWHLDTLQGLHINAPAVCVNGTQAVDRISRRVLFDMPLQQDVSETVKQVMSRYDCLSKVNFFLRDDTGNSVNRENPHEIPTENILKVVFVFTDEEQTIQCRDYLRSAVKGLKVMRSWPTGLEMIDESAGKDICVQRLKQLTGAEVLVAVGDFENDEAMLKAADISAVPGSGLEHLKQEADLVLCDVKEGVIADLIGRLN